MSSIEVGTSCDLFFNFFLWPDFREWCSKMSTCLFTEVKKQWAALVLWMGNRISAVLMSLTLHLTLIDQNPLWSCFIFDMVPIVIVCAALS